MDLQKERKILLLAIFFLITVKCEDGIQLLAEANNVTHQQVIHNNPIVIQTQLENYDQPTLREYQECHENAEKCKKVCEGVADVLACAKECPICPELIKEEQLVQGVNDTQIVPSKPLNTTNIIRLTNQIHNIIDNSRGNITYRNDNTLHLYQNVSRVGGKFGLGYNNTHSCCIIIRPKKYCDEKQFSTASPCHRKRHRVCGEQCHARVMLAKRVTVCDQPDTFDYLEDNAKENCHQTVKYVPYRNRRSNNKSTSPQCGYIPYWPFVTCQRHRPSCAVTCLRLPYSFILRNGIPEQCRSCYSTFGRNFNGGYMFDAYPPSFGWQHPIGSHELDAPIIDNDDMDFDTTGDWKVDKTKCILPDGSVSDDCIDSSGTNQPEAEDDYNEYDYLSGGPIVRKRRQTFSRSKYSHRYRHIE